MISWFSFAVKKSSSTEDAIEELLHYRISDISLIEEETARSLYGQGKGESFPPFWEHIDSLTPVNSSIAWEEQWQNFCPYFDGRICRVPLGDFYPESSAYIELLPGPGFGDLSHPTTTLMLHLLGALVPNTICLDLGCGSGILGIGAIKLGAKQVYCVDIDPEALAHTEKNAHLNDCSDKIISGFSCPKNACLDLILLNMIYGEQKEAIASLASISAPIWITSGILEEQKEDYLNFMNTLSLTPLIIARKEGWLAFVFSRIRDS